MTRDYGSTFQAVIYVVFFLQPVHKELQIIQKFTNILTSLMGLMVILKQNVNVALFFLPS